jgi:predicted P-loop ATPase
VHLYSSGRDWWPDAGFEREHIKPQQALRFEGDAWEETIKKHIESLSRVRVSDLAREALRIETAKIGTGEQRRIASVLTALGWRPMKDWQGRYYAPPATMTHEAP